VLDARLHGKITVGLKWRDVGKRLLLQVLGNTM